MKRYKFLFCLLAVLLIMPTSAALAAGSVDLTHPASLTVNAVYDKKPVPDMQFDVYLVSTIDEYGELTPLAHFSEYSALLDIRGRNDAAWQEAAQTIADAVEADDTIMPSYTAETDEHGTVCFSSLRLGLYLVIGHTVELDGYIYSTAPFFAVLPEQDMNANVWNYDITANAKPGQSHVRSDYEVIKIWKDSCHVDQRPHSITVQLLCDGEPYGEPVTLPENGRWSHVWHDLDVNHNWSVTESTQAGYASPDIRQEGNVFYVTNTCTKPLPPGKPTLPQTGQLWWPVPLLVCAGLVLVVTGLIRRRSEKDET